MNLQSPALARKSILVILFIFMSGIMLLGNVDTGVAPNVRVVEMYYYNVTEDVDEEEILCSTDAVLPITRYVITIDDDVSTAELAKQTLNELFAGELSSDEKSAGYVEPFFDQQFFVSNVSIEGNVANIAVEGNLPDGECKFDLAAAQIKKTAMQFEGIDDVIINTK
jgi:hypothetical protein